MIRPARYLIALLPLVALVAGGAPAHADPPAPPPEFQGLYSELSQNLTAFEGQIDAQWNGSVGDTRFAPGLATANGNKSVALLGSANWTRTMEMLDAFEAMGVKLVKIDLHYPLFTPAFHSYLAAHPPQYVNPYTYNADYFVGYPNSFYNKVVAELRSRGMGVWIEHSVLFGDLSVTPSAPYFADMRSAGVAAASARFLQERRDEMVLVATQLRPDYYTLIDEPTTEDANFGYFPGNVPILTEDGWRDLAQQGADAIAAADPSLPSLIGAGSGTWEGRGYTERFAALPELDYIDFHLYPYRTIGENFWQDLLDWTDYVRTVAPAKKVTLGEAWLYKASLDDIVGGTSAYELIGRDVYSFWEPLDRQFLDVMFKTAHLKDFEAVMPFWTQYYFKYVDYGDPAIEGMSGMQLVGYAGQQAVPNIQSVTLNGTGQKFVEVLAAAADADGDGIADSQDMSDSDADLLTDQTEHFCGSPANDGSRRPERLDTTFAGVDDDGDLAVDEALPAATFAYDCDGDGYTGTAEDNVFNAANRRDQDACGTNAWPADFVSGGVPDSTDRITITDLTSFVAPVRRLSTSPPDTGYDVRWDIMPGAGVFTKVVNISDLTSLIVVAPPMLGAVRAFSGPACPWPG